MGCRRWAVPLGAKHGAPSWHCKLAALRPPGSVRGVQNGVGGGGVVGWGGIQGGRGAVSLQGGVDVRLEGCRQQEAGQGCPGAAPRPCTHVTCLRRRSPQLLISCSCCRLPCLTCCAAPRPASAPSPSPRCRTVWRVAVAVVVCVWCVVGGWRVRVCVGGWCVCGGWWMGGGCVCGWVGGGCVSRGCAWHHLTSASCVSSHFQLKGNPSLLNTEKMAACCEHASHTSTHYFKIHPLF